VADQKQLPLEVALINHEEGRDVFRHARTVLRSQAPGVLATWHRHGEIGKPYGAHHGIRQW